MDKEHMFWGKMTYGRVGMANEEKIRVPRATYRCKAKDMNHLCKRVTDHEESCECICGKTIGEEQE